jgi:hypothetical protein
LLLAGIQNFSQLSVDRFITPHLGLVGNFQFCFGAGREVKLPAFELVVELGGKAEDDGPDYQIVPIDLVFNASRLPF